MSVSPRCAASWHITCYFCGPMGAFETWIDVRPLGGRRRGNRREIADELLYFFNAFWFRSLRRPWYGFAWDWVRVGDDSVLTIRPEEREGAVRRIVFRFYQGVDWPSSLGHHWVNVSLAHDRLSLADALDWWGYAIEPDAYPKLQTEQTRTDGLYFEHGGMIGVASRESIAWISNDSDVCPSPTPYGELDPKVRRIVDRVLASGSCACPLCKFTKPQRTDPQTLDEAIPELKRYALTKPTKRLGNREIERRLRALRFVEDGIRTGEDVTLALPAVALVREVHDYSQRKSGPTETRNAPLILTAAAGKGADLAPALASLEQEATGRSSATSGDRYSAAVCLLGVYVRLEMAEALLRLLQQPLSSLANLQSLRHEAARLLATTGSPSLLASFRAAASSSDDAALQYVLYWADVGCRSQCCRLV